MTEAHIPIGGGGETLDTAKWVEDPTKSWVAYTELHEAGEAQYFRFNITAGTLIDLRLGIPSVSIIFQTLVALLGAPVNALIIMTLIVILISFVSFFGTVRVLRKPEWESAWKNGLLLIVFGGISLFLWSGYLVGPMLLFIAGIGSAASSISKSESEVHDIIP